MITEKIPELQEKKYRKALLKAFGNEPIISYALKTKDGLFRISNKKQVINDDEWIGWPINGVFEFDENEFKRLSELFKNNKKEKLEEAWSNQKSFT